MIAVTHLVVCLLLIELMHLDRNDAFVAWVFGVFIDLDHLFGLRDYVQANGVMAVFDMDDIVNPGGHWKSLMHSPIAVMVVGPVFIAFRLAARLVVISLAPRFNRRTTCSVKPLVPCLPPMSIVRCPES